MKHGKINFGSHGQTRLPVSSPFVASSLRRFVAHSRAFTLVEVLATLLIIGIVMPVAMQGINLALGAASTAKRQAEAATLAQGKLDELIATNDWSSAAGQGDFAPDFPDYKWQLQSTSREYDTVEIAITVTWQQQGQDRSLTVATLVSSAVAEGTGASSSGVLP